MTVYPLMEVHNPEGYGSCCMQVIFCTWTVLPPSAWFKPGNPLPYIAITLIVFLISIAAAWVHKRLRDLALRGNSGSRVIAARKAMGHAVALHVVAGACMQDDRDSTLQIAHG